MAGGFFVVRTTLRLQGPVCSSWMSPGTGGHTVTAAAISNRPSDRYAHGRRSRTPSAAPPGRETLTGRIGAANPSPVAHTPVCSTYVLNDSHHRHAPQRPSG